jgi:uncharacterized protein YqjF (DUF2071 family)
MNRAANPTAELSRRSRARFLSSEKKPLLIGDWMRALFLHFEVPVEELRRCVPFDLDLWEDQALVSVVAFSMERLRPGFGGALGRRLFWPISNHRFLNVRAYVRHQGRPGIFFLSEWLDNRLCVLCGPVTYGLPYRFAHIQDQHCPGEGRLAGTVADGFAYTAEITRNAAFETCADGGLDEFLLERYTAFTGHNRRFRYFDIAHEPWLQAPAEAQLTDDRLLRGNFPWFAHARYLGAHYSPGVQNVWMGAPRHIDCLNPAWPKGR